MDMVRAKARGKRHGNREMQTQRGAELEVAGEWRDVVLFMDVR